MSPRLPDSARDCRSGPTLLAHRWQSLLEVTILLRSCVLSWRRRVEANAGSAILTILAGVDIRAACDAARGAADGLTNIPLTLLCEPPESC